MPNPFLARVSSAVATSRAPTAPERHRHLRPALALAGGTALVVVLLWLADPAEVLAALGRARWTTVGMAFACYAAFFAIRGVRWRLLLGPGGAGAGTAAMATASGWLVSTFVPMKAGDVVRAAFMGRRHGAGFAAASGSVALERLLDVAGLAVACTLALVALRWGLHGGAIPAALGEAVALAWLLPLLGLLVLIALGLVVTPERRRNAVLRFAGRALDQARVLLHKPRLWVPVGALTAASTLAQALVYVFLVLAFLPAADPALVLAGAPLFLLSFAIALTPGHLGTYEAAFALVFSSLGLGSGADLVAIGFAIHLLTVSMVTVLGGLSSMGLALQGSHGPHRSPSGSRPASAVDEAIP